MGLGVCMSLILLYRLYTILYTCHYHKPYYYYYSYSLGHGANNLKSFLIASYGLSVSLLFEMYLIHDNLTSNYFTKRKNDRSRPKANIPIYPNKAVNHSSLPLYSLFSWVAPKSFTVHLDNLFDQSQRTQVSSMCTKVDGVPHFHQPLFGKFLVLLLEFSIYRRIWK